jgi:hypothetical protein
MNKIESYNYIFDYIINRLPDDCEIYLIKDSLFKLISNGSIDDLKFCVIGLDKDKLLNHMPELELYKSDDGLLIYATNIDDIPVKISIRYISCGSSKYRYDESMDINSYLKYQLFSVLNAAYDIKKKTVIDPYNSFHTQIIEFIDNDICLISSNNVITLLFKVAELHSIYNYFIDSSIYDYFIHRIPSILETLKYTSKTIIGNYFVKIFKYNYHEINRYFNFLKDIDVLSILIPELSETISTCDLMKIKYNSNIKPETKLALLLNEFSIKDEVDYIKEENSKSLNVILEDYGFDNDFIKHSVLLCKYSDIIKTFDLSQIKYLIEAYNEFRLYDCMGTFKALYKYYYDYLEHRIDIIYYFDIARIISSMTPSVILKDVNISSLNKQEMNNMLKYKQIDFFTKMVEDGYYDK